MQNFVSQPLIEEYRKLLADKLILSVQLQKMAERAEKAETAIQRLHTGKASLQNAINMGQTSRHGLGYSDLKKFVISIKSKPAEKVVIVDSSSQKVKKIRKCNYCKKEGHVKNRCYKLTKVLMSQLCHDTKPQNPRGLCHNTRAGSKILQVWKPKEVVVCLMSNTNFDSFAEDAWYFDSACSRHMTGCPELLDKIVPGFGGYVKFGDGKKSRVVGKGELFIKGFPVFNDVLLVDGLKANLLSISNLCDNDMLVYFNKEKCTVEHNGVIFTISR